MSTTQPRRRLRHGGWLVAVTLGASTLMFVPASAQAAPSTGQAAPTRIRVQITAPQGVPATVRLTSGDKHRAAKLPADATKVVRTLRVTPGTWRVTGQAVIAEGEVWVVEARKPGDPRVEQHAVVIRVRAHHTAVVQAQWYAGSWPRLRVARTTAATTVLRWNLPITHVRFMLRRGGPGEAAPDAPDAGTAVYNGTAHKAVARHLQSSQTYAYSLFVRNLAGHGDATWAGPASVSGTTNLCSAQTSLSSSECEAVLDIARANPGAHLRDWWSGDPCDWRGTVSCNAGHVDELILGGAGLHTVPDSIGDLPELALLDLSHDQVASLPAATAGLDHLGILHLAGNRLTSVPTGVRNLSHLDWLDLSDNRLTRLPGWVGDLPGLYRLRLDHNSLETLPDTLAGLGGLRVLRAADNNLTVVPASLRHLPSLETLNLRGNRLRALPKWVGTLPVRTLVLGGNRLAKVPASLGTLARVRDLGLEHNRLHRVPASIGDLVTLHRIDLRDNHLSGDISPWAGPLSREGSIVRGTNSVGLTGNGCLTAGGDASLRSWLDEHSDGWRGAC